MRSIFDNLQNTPFGDLSKGVLNTDVLKGNVLNTSYMPQTGGKYKNYEEQSFKTFNNYYELKRYYQALKYGLNDKQQEAYGMECNAVTLMYFLQSLGLIPPEMRRKEFEYAFTTLSPYDDKQSIQKQKEITINGIKPMEFGAIDNRIIQKPLNLKPKNLIDSQYLSESALLGGKFGISLINQTLETALLKLEKITKSFAEFPYEP